MKKFDAFVTIILSTLVAMLLPTQFAFAEVIQREGKYFEIGKTSGSPLFTQHIRVEDLADGTRQSKSSITDPQGEVVMREETILKNEKVISQRVDQLQLKLSYELKVQDGTATFKTFKLNGEERTESEPANTEKIRENFITGPVTENFIKNHIAALDSGKTLAVQFGIFEYQKSVAFEFSRNKKKPSEKDSLLAITMRPSSFWLDLLVDTIYLEFDKTDLKIVHYKGRTPLRTLVDKKLKPLDAEIIYTTISSAPKK